LVDEVLQGLDHTLALFFKASSAFNGSGFLMFSFESVLGEPVDVRDLILSLERRVLSASSFEFEEARSDLEFSR
jgi:hypothetical protein